MTPADVIRASNAWIYVPEGSPTVETVDYLLVRFPDHFANPLELVRFTPTRPLPELLAEVLLRARQFGLPSLVWRVLLDSPPGVEELLREIGTVDETLDVLALDLHRGPARPRYPATPNACWGPTCSPPATRWRSASRCAASCLPTRRCTGCQRATRSGFLSVAAARAVAYLDGRPAAAAGPPSRGPAAGLWGGAVLDGFRGRGIYRALLAARLEYAAANYGTYAAGEGSVDNLRPDPAPGRLRGVRPGAGLPDVADHSLVGP